MLTLIRRNKGYQQRKKIQTIPICVIAFAGKIVNSS